MAKVSRSTAVSCACFADGTKTRLGRSSAWLRYAGPPHSHYASSFVPAVPAEWALTGGLMLFCACSCSRVCMCVFV